MGFSPAVEFRFCGVGRHNEISSPRGALLRLLSPPMPRCPLLPLGSFGLGRFGCALLNRPLRLVLGQLSRALSLFRCFGGLPPLLRLASGAFGFRLALAELLLDQREGAGQPLTSESKRLWEISIPCRRASFFRLSGRSWALAF